MLEVLAALAVGGWVFYALYHAGIRLVRGVEVAEQAEAEQYARATTRDI